MQQSIGISLGIHPAPFCVNLLLYWYEAEYTSDKFEDRHFHLTKHFTDDLCSINGGDKLGKSFSDVYPKELELNTFTSPMKI